MKKTIFPLTILLLFLSLEVIKAQNQSEPLPVCKAFEKGEKYTSLGGSATQYFHLDPFNRNNYDSYYYGRLAYTTTTGEFNIQSEKAVSEYVGVGMNLGLGGNNTRIYPYHEANLAIGPIVNFHFYQLIADKTANNLHADKLDIYAGLNLGAGFAFQYYPNDLHFLFLAYGGFQAGIRYFVLPRFAFNLEVGYGKSLINGGVTIKMRKKNA